LTIPANSIARLYAAHRCKHVCFGAQLRSCLHAEATSGPLKAPDRLSVGIGWLCAGTGMAFYSRTNFKLNRAVSLAEWRQLLSA